MWKLIKLIFTIVLLLIAAGIFFAEIGTIPDSKAVVGSDLPEKALRALKESGIVGENEEIEYYYSEDLFSFSDYGNLFTNSRVISYELDNETNERNVYSALYSEISDLKIIRPEDILDDAVIQVYIKGEHAFDLVVSTEDGGHEKFFNGLVQKWKNR
jgi:hypothetical protein